MARSNSFKNIFKLIDAEINELEPYESFLSDLKRSIELDDKKNTRTPSKTYKPSMMNCIRASYYQIRGFEPDTDQSNYSMIGICNSGTDIHERIQCAVSNMKENGMDCEYINVADYIYSRELKDLEVVSRQGYETKLYHKKLNISFLCDGIIKYRDKYYILEIKSESGYKFLNRKDVDPKHYNQAITYSLAFGINEVIFLYISRDLLDMKSYCFSVTTDMKNTIISYIEECDGYVARKVAPPKPASVTNTICRYCGYKTQCKGDG